jgi:hypothetical protein
MAHDEDHITARAVFDFDWASSACHFECLLHQLRYDGTCSQPGGQLSNARPSSRAAPGAPGYQSTELHHLHRNYRLRGFTVVSGVRRLRQHHVCGSCRRSAKAMSFPPRRSIWLLLLGARHSQLHYRRRRHGRSRDSALHQGCHGHDDLGRLRRYLRGREAVYTVRQARRLGGDAQ